MKQFTAPLMLLIQAAGIQIIAFLLAIYTPTTVSSIAQLNIAPNERWAIHFFTQSMLAWMLAQLSKQPVWWRWIHFGFPLAIWLCLQASLPSWLYGLLFLLIFLVYGSTAHTRVPLYLSNAITCKTVSELIPSCGRIADLGSGTGTVLIELAKFRPDCQITGYETAWIPYLISRWRSRNLAQIKIYRRSFWKEDLNQFDVLYTFLSPQPMPMLWQKLQQEKKQPRSILISNSFPVPGATPKKNFRLTDGRKTRLYLYQI